jgi:uncharacterized protein YqjF (DUF2071 family)
MTNALPFLTAFWKDLALLNFEVDPALIAPHVPAGTELDLWEGKTLVSLVGFRFLDTKVLGFPIPLHRDFDEVNLRFYVRGPEGRGVVFLREIVPRRAIAAVARLFYGEKYVAAPMEHSLDVRGGCRRVSYSWRWNGRQNLLAVQAQGEPVPFAEGSAEAFILEHYWGYTRTGEGGSIAYRVEHPPWSTWSVTGGQCSVDGDSLYGPGFGDVLGGPFVSAMLAEGSPVSVFRGRAATSARLALRREDPTSPEA